MVEWMVVWRKGDQKVFRQVGHPADQASPRAVHEYILSRYVGQGSDHLARRANPRCRGFAALSSPADSSCVFSPFLLRNLRIFSAKPALTSPSRRPSTTSQSRAPATSMGLIYSWKCSRATRKLSPGGAERKTVILRGMRLTGRVSWATWDTRWHHLCWALFLW